MAKKMGTKSIVASKGIPELKRSAPDVGVYQSKVPHSGESANNIPTYEHPGLKALRAAQDARRSRGKSST